MRKIKRFAAVMLTALTIMPMVGCGTIDVEDNNAEIANDQKTISFSWWGNDKRHQYTMDGIDLFEEMHPDINVQYKFGEWSGYVNRNRVWMKSKSAADLMQINYDWLQTYSPDGAGYYDLNKLADYIDLSYYNADDLKYGTQNGVLNAVPLAFNTSTLIMNETLLKEYGFEKPTSWDDLFVIAEEVSKDGRYVLSTQKKHVFLMLIAYYEQTEGREAFGNHGECLIDKDGVGLMLDVYKKMMDTKLLMPVENFDRTRFANAECLGTMCWVSDADSYCSGPVDNGYDVVMCDYPMLEDAKLPGTYIKPATLYAINADTSYPEEAAELLNFLLSDTGMILLQGTEKGVPINSKAIEVLEENDQLNTFGYDAFTMMQKHRDNLSLMKPVMEDSALIDDFMEICSAYLYDVESRSEVIDKLYNRFYGVQ